MIANDLSLEIQQRNCNNIIFPGDFNTTLTDKDSSKGINISKELKSFVLNFNMVDLWSSKCDPKDGAIIRDGQRLIFKLVPDRCILVFVISK